MNDRGPVAVIDWLLKNRRAASGPPLPSLADWKSLFDGFCADWPHTLDRAIGGGFLADRVAYAFAAGYESALRRLVPSLADNRITALCVTEEGGGHPRAITTSMERAASPGRDTAAWRLSGKKKFVSMAVEAERLLVAASLGTSSAGKNDLRLVVVELPAAGVRIEPMSSLPFIPEISHGRLFIDNAFVADDRILPGDGYADYIKPFRTIEDIHVTAAVVAYAFRCACRYDWPHELRERMLALMLSLRSLSVERPDHAAVHLLYAGLSHLFAGVIDDLMARFEGTDEPTRSAWKRDSALLAVADKARSARLAKAREQYN